MSPVAAGALVTLTLSKTAVLIAEFVCAVTARPTYTDEAIVIVCAVPCCVQVLPSAERSAVRTLPVRVRRTQ
jgi:hypothetical protein